MLTEDRMAASKKGYENGIRAVPAEERMAAHANRYENGIGVMQEIQGKERNIQ